MIFNFKKIKELKIEKSFINIINSIIVIVVLKKKKDPEPYKK